MHGRLAPKAAVADVPPCAHRAEYKTGTVITTHRARHCWQPERGGRSGTRVSKADCAGHGSDCGARVGVRRIALAKCARPHPTPRQDRGRGLASTREARSQVGRGSGRRALANDEGSTAASTDPRIRRASRQRSRGTCGARRGRRFGNRPQIDRSVRICTSEMSGEVTERANGRVIAP